MDSTPCIRSHSAPVPLYLPPALATPQARKTVLWLFRSHFNFQWCSPSWCDRQHKHVYTGKQHWWTRQGLWLLLHLKVVTDRQSQEGWSLSVHGNNAGAISQFKNKTKTQIKILKTGIFLGGRGRKSRRKRGEERGRGEMNSGFLWVKLPGLAQWRLAESLQPGGDSGSVLFGKPSDPDNPGGPAKVTIRPRVISNY